MLDFLKSKFEYFLISFWMFVFTAVIIYFVAHNSPDKAQEWGFNAFSALMGALLGLITGHRMARQDQIEASVAPTPDKKDAA